MDDEALDTVEKLEAAGYRRAVKGEYGFFASGALMTGFVDSDGHLVVLAGCAPCVGARTPEGEALLQAAAEKYLMVVQDAHVPS